jgi:uncharacterized protein involved in exopolysaccharide biosynthesis
VPEVPGVPDDAAGLRAANARLRELLAERDERIAGQDAEIAVLREQLSGLQSQVADLAARVASNSRNSSKPAVVGRPGEAVTEVAAREVWAQAGPAERPAGGDDAAHGPS